MAKLFKMFKINGVVFFGSMTHTGDYHIFDENLNDYGGSWASIQAFKDSHLIPLGRVDHVEIHATPKN
jgi:hypothetical protein